MEAVLTFGGSSGPVVGSVLYAFFGYLGMFVIMGCFFLVLFPFMIFTQPPNLNDTEDTQRLNSSDSALPDENVKEISYYNLLSDHVVQLLSIALILGFWSLSYTEPVLSFRLLDFTDSLSTQSLVFL